MEDNKLFDLFRDNEHKLAEQPNAEVWSRIEARMQAVHTAEPRPSAHRLHVRHIRRVLAFAASLALVLGLAVSYLWVTDTTDDSLSALQGNILEMEELELAPPVPVVATEAITTTVAATRQRPVRAIQEGVAGQRLIVKAETAPAPTAVPHPVEDTARHERNQRTGR